MGRMRRVVVGVDDVRKDLIPSVGLRRVRNKLHAYCADPLVDDLLVEGFCLSVPPWSVGCGEAMDRALHPRQNAEELIVDSGVSV